MRALALLILAACWIPTSAAQDVFLGAPEARRVFFGIDMRGRHEPSNTEWRECITPTGRTSFWHLGALDEGRLAIRADGALCFSYASTNFSRDACWKAKRLTATSYRFESTDGGDGVFVASVTRPAQSCPARDAPMS